MGYFFSHKTFGLVGTSIRGLLVPRWFSKSFDKMTKIHLKISGPSDFVFELKAFPTSSSRLVPKNKTNSEQDKEQRESHRCRLQLFPFFLGTQPRISEFEFVTPLCTIAPKTSEQAWSSGNSSTEAPEMTVAWRAEAVRLDKPVSFTAVLPVVFKRGKRIQQSSRFVRKKNIQPPAVVPPVPAAPPSLRGRGVETREMTSSASSRTSSTCVRRSENGGDVCGLRRPGLWLPSRLQKPRCCPSLPVATAGCCVLVQCAKSSSGYTQRLP